MTASKMGYSIESKRLKRKIIMYVCGASKAEILLPFWRYYVQFCACVWGLQI